jgi:hypothetical protein
MEIRQVTAQIIHRYDVQFAPEQNPKAFVEGLRDCFTIAMPSLKLVFTDRSQSTKA